jgi:predicted DNA-binding transcriptional regulator AlpA
MKHPTSKTAFRRWLAAQVDLLAAIDEYGEPDFFVALDTAEIVGQASRLACRFGAGHLIGDELPTPTPRQGLAVVGRLLAWAEQGEPPDLLSVVEVAGRLGTSVRSVWRMRSRGEIPQPVAILGKTKWRSVEIQAMIDLSPTKKVKQNGKRVQKTAAR